MKSICVLIFFFNINILLVLTTSVCKRVDQCSCRFEDKGTYISLRPIDHPDSSKPLFSDIPQSGLGFTFDYNPCTGINEIQCKNDLVCQKYSFVSSQSYSIAQPNTLNIRVQNENVVFRYDGVKGTDGIQRHVEITLKCDPHADKPAMTNPTEDDTVPKNPMFRFQLTSKHACEKNDGSNGGGSKHGLSIGSILCIVFLVLVVVYFVAGILFLKYYKKNEGTEILPNKEFWKDFPSKVKDGVTFTCGKIRRNGGEYEKI